MYYNVEPYFSLLVQIEKFLEQPDFFACICGEQGSGKSALLAECAARLQTSGVRVVHFSQPPSSPVELRTRLLQAFQTTDTQNYTQKIRELLDDATLSNSGIVIIFDDVDLMDDATLLELTKLTDIPTHNNSRFGILIAGDTKLARRISQEPALLPLNQRISANIHLPLIDKRTMPAFVMHHAINANRPDMGCEKDVVALLTDLSGGRPGAVIEILNAVMSEVRYPNRAGRVTLRHLRKAMSNPALAYSKINRRRVPRTSIPRVAALVVVMSLAGAILIFVGRSPTPDTNPLISTLPVAETSASTTEALHEPSVMALTQTNAESEPELDQLAQATLDEPPEARPETAPEVITEAIIVADLPPTPVELAEAVLQQWAAAWQAQDMGGYFAAYDSTFLPRGFRNQAEWRDSRTRNIQRREIISVQIGEITVLSMTDTNMVVSFWLDYRASGYRDMTLKQIELVTQASDPVDWRIREEINRQVILQ